MTIWECDGGLTEESENLLRFFLFIIFGLGIWKFFEIFLFVWRYFK